jgi:hypothetical protein
MYCGQLAPHLPCLPASPLFHCNDTASQQGLPIHSSHPAFTHGHAALHYPFSAWLQSLCSSLPRAPTHPPAPQLRLCVRLHASAGVTHGAAACGVAVEAEGAHLPLLIVRHGAAAAEHLLAAVALRGLGVGQLAAAARGAGEGVDRKGRGQGAPVSRYQGQ